MSVHLHIERLVIDGSLLRPNESWPVQQALESELTRLLAEGEIRARSASRLTNDFRIKPNRSPERLGSQIATAIQQSLGRRSGR